jgi:hypothetical protein
MMMGTSQAYFSVIAEASATLTGLLFVAMSVAPRREVASHLGVVQQVRAAAALLAFTSALAISLFGLIMTDNVRVPAIVLGVSGVCFTAAGMRSIFESTKSWPLLRKQMGLIVLLLATFGTELGSGVALEINKNNEAAMITLKYVLTVSLLIGIARAWELVGSRDTGLFSSLAVLSGRDHTASETDDGADSNAIDPPKI